MAIYANIPQYYLPTTSNSGIINIFGGIVHEKTGVNYSPPIYTESVVYNVGYLESAYNDQYTLNTIEPEKDKILVPYEPLYTYEALSYDCGCEGALGFAYLPYVIDNYALYQIFSSNHKVFAATITGLEIYNINTEILLVTKTIQGVSINTVGGNSSTVYVGTSDGLYNISLIDLENDITTELLKVNLNLSSNNIKYLHCSNNYLGVCTVSGVDYLALNTNPSIHSKNYITNSKKCFVTANSLYYTVSGTNTYSLHRADNVLCDWEVPDKSYLTNGTIFKNNIKLTDLYITSSTAKNDGNTIFCTTSSGVYVIDEDTQKYLVYYTTNLK